jgi:hypothetical protein
VDVCPVQCIYEYDPTSARLNSEQMAGSGILENSHQPNPDSVAIFGDTLARTGQSSRAEVTDAAMSERAECVMLNKGPYITQAISALDSILTRMNDHQDKKRSLLRRLRSWDRTPRVAADPEPSKSHPTSS